MHLPACPLPVLHTSRLRLRPLAPADVPALFEIFSHPEVVRYWSTPALPDLAAARTLLDEIDALARRQQLFQWGVALAQPGSAAHDTLVGTCTLRAAGAAQNRAEVGFALAHAHWRRGYAREALAGLLTYAFDTVGLRRIEADVDPRNVSSLHVLEGLGFVREGYLHERWQVNGEVQDSVLLGLLARAWRTP